MRALFLQYSERIGASYWFIPSIMAVGAAILAFVLIEVDLRVPPDAFGNNPFFFATQPDGARSILSAIGGSMIGVAGTVFSVTMATVVFASGSYGPRLLSNFMNDRGNQVTLGVFVATFVYSMLVLRSVRDGGSEDIYAAMFVPNIAIFGAIVLAIGSIGILIFFIHHVPSTIHISNVIAGIGGGLLRDIGNRFPKHLGEPAEEENRAEVLWQVPACFRPDAADDAALAPYREIEMDYTGYIQVIDYETLMHAARDHEIVVRMNCRPGTFAHSGRVLFDAWPSERVTDEVRSALVAAIALGHTRSVTQDLLFLFDELVEIAARALSPGVNDPFTALTCLDWLTAAMSELAGRSPPDSLRVDEDHKLRVIGGSMAFAGYVDHSFGHLRQYAAADMIAAEHFIDCLARVAPACRRQDELRALHDQKEALLALAREGLGGASLETVEAAGRRFDEQLAHPRLRSTDRGPLSSPAPEPAA
ncbi:DUF2254 domain-containing protein [Aurantimonas marina]|uniref:DUF2254 domain-containing protein n=1 Tax=Aurantimonas marina TaxID=2780508 RepID=UPI0019D2EB45|nr:DUF2254 domain-containing protein [Aurantimonas marina]